jgi:murein DD-endopeptidase MepM/ murein hydrolase activator NlpD
VVGIVGIVGLVVIMSIISLIAFTPLRELIPGYPNSQTRRQIIVNTLRLDSLQQQVQQWVIYNDNVSRILAGKEPVSIENKNNDTLIHHYNNIVLSKSKVDSLFRLQVEGISTLYEPADNGIESLNFVAPLQGKIVKPFALSNNFYRINIRSSSTVVVAACDGVVSAVYWTEKDQYVVIIQHRLGIITIYKHLGKCVVPEGKQVKTGEILGATNDEKWQKENNFSLAFEMWYDGVPVNPDLYIDF